MNGSLVARRVVIYGILLFVIWNILLLILSFIFGFETEIPTIASIALVVLMPIITSILAKRLRPSTLKESVYYGFGWTIVVLLFTLIVTTANDTTSVIFNSWPIYAMYSLMALSPLFGIVRDKNS